MSITPVTPIISLETKINNKLENLFKLTQVDEWDQIYFHIEKEPYLLNEMIKEGPDAGKTILYVACLDPKNNDTFLQKVFDLGIPFDMNATPKEGVDRGKTVFWNLAFALFKNGPWYNFKLLLEKCIVNFDCDINAAPKDSPFKGVTAFYLLLGFPTCTDLILSRFPSFTNSAYLPHFDQSVPGHLISWIHHIEYASTHFEQCIKNLNLNYNLINAYSTDEIRNHCYQSMFNIIEEIQTSDLHAISCYCDTEIDDNESGPRLPLDVILSLPPSPHRNTLLFCLILAGAKSVTSEQKLKDEYEGIQKRLYEVYRSAIEAIHLKSSLRSLPQELVKGIVYDMILNAIPEFKDISPRLIQKFFLELNLKVVNRL